ncbi:MAG: hypothetical protein EOO04_11800 [Chitinophagaceae bacterium]|nr:MAG: hypothetical protein EOO04_11800 [Chitinophagaceae bacterium]
MYTHMIKQRRKTLGTRK